MHKQIEKLEEVLRKARVAEDTIGRIMGVDYSKDECDAEILRLNLITFSDEAMIS